MNESKQDPGLAVEVTPIQRPPTGVPALTTTEQELARVTQKMADGVGPLAVDAERASAFRYGQRAQLVQLFRREAGLVLIDPVALPNLSTLSDVLQDTEWVLHAASQDLACLRQVGMVPPQLFDTELASRLLGHTLVGLAAVVARTLGMGLAKEHSAQDWSIRPLPEDWLNYAALDVAVLVDVRDVLAAELETAGKMEIAKQEFQAVLDTPPPPPRVDPWRRTSGTHKIRDRRGMAVVRALWEARDSLARKLDQSPSRVLPDAGIVAAGLAKPTTSDQLGQIHPFGGRGQKRRRAYWWNAVDQALHLPTKDLPFLHGPKPTGPPGTRAWTRHYPQAAKRLAQVKAELAQISTAQSIPVLHLSPTQLVRQVVFDAPPDPAAALRAGGAREWQIELVAPVLAKAAEAYPDNDQPPDPS